MTFWCSICKQDVHITHEAPARGMVCGLEGNMWERTYTCGHKERCFDHSSTYASHAETPRGRKTQGKVKTSR